MKNITMRPLRATDAQAVLAFLKTVGGQTKNLTFGSKGISVDVQEERCYLDMNAESEDSCELGAFDGGELVANGSIKRVSCCRPRMAHRFSVAVSVRKSHWGQGIATALLKRLIQEARIRGAEVMELEVLCSNTSAIRVYESLGFRIVGTYEKYFRYAPGEYADAYWMNLYL